MFKLLVFVLALGGMIASGLLLNALDKTPKTTVTADALLAPSGKLQQQFSPENRRTGIREGMGINTKDNIRPPFNEGATATAGQRGVRPRHADNTGKGRDRTNTINAGPTTALPLAPQARLDATLAAAEAWYQGQHRAMLPRAQGLGAGSLANYQPSPPVGVKLTSAFPPVAVLSAHADGASNGLPYNPAEANQGQQSRGGENPAKVFHKHVSPSRTARVQERRSIARHILTSGTWGRRERESFSPTRSSMRNFFSHRQDNVH